MIRKIIGACISISILVIVLSSLKIMLQTKKDSNKIKYVAIGDSYSIGEGASEAESWPRILTNHLKNEGVSITLIANPSVTGWTTQQVIDYELPIFDRSNPTFATLQIGVNDWVQGVEKDLFHYNLRTILDRMQEKLTQKDNLIMITIPDFSVTPTGKKYSAGRDIAKGLREFNEIIINEGKKRGLRVVDIFQLSQEMGTDRQLVARDGLHPSAKEYALWEKAIYPVALATISKRIPQP